MKYILIMVIGWANGQGGVTAISQEFDSWKACEAARVSVAKVHQSGHASIVSHGCYAKGDAK